MQDRAPYADANPVVVCTAVWAHCHPLALRLPMMQILSTYTMLQSTRPDASSDASFDANFVDLYNTV